MGGVDALSVSVVGGTTPLAKPVESPVGISDPVKDTFTLTYDSGTAVRCCLPTFPNHLISKAESILSASINIIPPLPLLPPLSSLPPLSILFLGPSSHPPSPLFFPPSLHLLQLNYVYPP